MGAFTYLLVARDSSRGPARFRPQASEQRVGRDPASDLAIADATVSRRHAVLRRDGSRLEVEDLGSAGGTYVNETRVQRCPLSPGDVVRFGPRVEYEVAQEVDTGSTSLALDLNQLRRAAEPRPEEGENLRHLQTLMDVARALNAATVLDEVLQVVLQAAAKLLDAERGAVMLLDEAGGRTAAVSFPPGTSSALSAESGALLERAVAGRRRCRRRQPRPPAPAKDRAGGRGRSHGACSRVPRASSRKRPGGVREGVHMPPWAATRSTQPTRPWCPLRTKQEGPANELSKLACRPGSDRVPLDYFDQPADTRAR